MDNENNKENLSRHTWIGEENKIDDPDKMEWSEDAPRRETPIGDGIGGVNTVTTDVFKTRVVEKQKKPYSGFITDEELSNSDIFPKDSRRELKLDREELMQTRVYTGFPGIDREPEPEPESAAASFLRGSKTIRISDKTKFRRLIAAGVILLLLLAYVISYVCISNNIKDYPDKTEALKAQTEEVTEENSTLKEETEVYGDYDQMKESKESWERLKEKIEQSE